MTSGLPSWCDEKTLLARIDQEERFYAGQFQAHLDEGSSTAEHCRRHLLSALADERFVCDCDHARADGGAVPDLETQEERIRRTHHRAARTTEDWEKTCVICADASEDEEKTGRMYCCLYCATVIHKKCGIKHDRSDFPHDDDESEWVCVTCAELESARRHDSRCLECESLGFLLRDLTTLADLARHQNKASENAELTEWIVSATAHAADLLRKYRAHKIRDNNQDQFQRLQLKLLSFYAATKLSDWWGKIGHMRHHTACCQFPQGGLGVHGSYYVWRNPTLAMRIRLSALRGGEDVDWNEYPPAPDADPPGPEFCCEFHRSACNDATQGSFHTAAVRLASDEEFFANKWWLTEGISGETTDGCVAQYNSALPMLYNLTNPYLKRKCTKERGEGKDRIDSNCSNDQPKLIAEVNRKGGRIEQAADVSKALDQDRARGNVTAEAEFDADSMPTGKIPPIYRLKDYKFADVEGPTLILWEVFSAALSEACGRFVGLGAGWHFSDTALREKHALACVRPPKATLRHNAFDFKTGSAKSNPLPLLSHAQRVSAAGVAAAKRDDATAKRDDEATREAARRSALYQNTLLACGKCGAQFQRQAWLTRHEQSNCGRFLKRFERRQQLVREGTEARLAVLDEAELQETTVRHEARSDAFTMTLTAADPGWTLHAKIGNATVPIGDVALEWKTPSSATALKCGDRVRCSAEHFESWAKKKLGIHWREQFFYGQACRRVGRPQSGAWAVRYDGEDEELETHISLIEHGTPTESATETTAKAVVHALDLDGAAAKQGAYCGLLIDKVGDVDVTAAQVAGAIASAVSTNGSAGVAVRRPLERRPRKGMARECNNDNEQCDWHPEVEAEAVRLANNPMNDKRDSRVFTELEAKYKHCMADGKQMMPTPQAVTNLCKREWGKRKKQKKEDAQNKAAAAVAQAERRSSAEEADDEEEEEDEDEEELGDAGAADEDAGDSTGGWGVERQDGDDGAGGAIGGDLLDALDLPELRWKLKEFGERATVTNGDLAGAMGTNENRARVLRARLRAMYESLE